jgi:hypothetical protein
MVGIKNITSGRFGNRVLQYNNLIQLSKKLNLPAYCQKWEGHDWFEGLVLNENTPPDNPVELDWDNFLKEEHFKKNNFCLGPNIIHNYFYDITHVNPRSFLKIKKEFLPDFTNQINLGIHIRGGDFITANKGREVISFSFYKNAIDLVLSSNDIDNIFICTDDMTYNLVNEVYKYCQQVHPNNTFWGKSSGNRSLPHIYDFSTLTECDYLICGSSTYTISASIIGKEKKVILPEEWLRKNVHDKNYVVWGNYTNNYPKDYWYTYDIFWQKVYGGGNEFYKAWKII